MSAWFGTVGVEGWLRYRGRVTSSWEDSDEKAKLKTETTSCTEKGTVNFFSTLLFSSSNGNSDTSYPQIARPSFLLSVSPVRFFFLPNRENNLLSRLLGHHAMKGPHQSA